MKLNKYIILLLVLNFKIFSMEEYPFLETIPSDDEFMMDEFEQELNSMSDQNKKIEKVLALKLYSWSQKHAKENLAYQAALKEKLQNILNTTDIYESENFSVELKKLLKLGLEPNSELKFKTYADENAVISRILKIVFYSRCCEDIKLLLDYGADPNFIIQDSDRQYTLLGGSIGAPKLDKCKLLLENGVTKADANLIYLDRLGNKKTFFSSILLDKGMIFDFITFVRLLLKNGADPRIIVDIQIFSFEPSKNETGSILDLYKKYFYERHKEALFYRLGKTADKLPDILELLEKKAKKLDASKNPTKSN